MSIMNNDVHYCQLCLGTRLQLVSMESILDENFEILVDLKTILDKFYSSHVLKMLFSCKIYQIFSPKSMSWSLDMTILNKFHVIF